MNLPLVREFKLAGRGGDGRHAYINENGAFIGRGVPLLERDALGRWRPRDRAVLERLFAKGFGVPAELGWRMTQLAYVGQALNKNDLGLASISLVRAELPPLPSAEHARVMAKADGLLVKYNPDWEDEPRVPKGDSAGGEWTTGGGPGDDVVDEDTGSTGVIQVAASGDLPCQGFCQSGGTYGTTATYNVYGKNVCRDCAVKCSGSMDCPVPYNLES